jgi:putative spermidine/putrescine transport system ATP-binding protein
MLVSRAGLRLPIRPGCAAVGDVATLLLRPEKITIAAEGGSDGVLVEGEVAEAIYLGEATRYIVGTAGGEVLTVKQQNSSPAGALKVGARVGLRWDPTAANTRPLTFEVDRKRRPS